jgi:hypothetical protein
VTFRKGASGNPAGKLRGTRNRTSVLIERLLTGEAEGVTKKVLELALPATWSRSNSFSIAWRHRAVISRCVSNYPV